jgi:predicted TIM-barrel fold metal-dependent hydrolase
MVFDIHTALGHWPYRRVPGQTPAELRSLLQAAQIDGAAAANTHGLFYKNCHDANLELAEWLAPHGDFYVGVATLNPTYAAWERDLVTCASELGFRALRLAPQYHDYALVSDAAIAIARAAAKLGLPLLISHRVVDVRQRHWFDTERVVDVGEIGALCEKVPQATVIVTESRYPAAALMNEDRSPRYPGLYLESSRVDMDAFPEPFAAERVLFGTGAPFKHVTPALLKVETTDLQPESKARIYAGNARTLLGL